MALLENRSLNSKETSQNVARASGSGWPSPEPEALANLKFHGSSVFTQHPMDP